MLDTRILELATEVAFLVVFAFALSDLVRNRRRHELDVAVLFGSLAIVILIQDVSRVTGLVLPWANTVGALCLVVQPYLLLRLVEHFRVVPRWQQGIGLAGVVGSWGLILWGGLELPAWATVAVVAYFIYVDGYATLSLARSIFTARGVIQRRLIALAIGSGLLTSVFVLAGLVGLWPDAKGALKIVSSLLALGSAFGYYVGVAPPRWLRNAWQMTELRGFLGSLGGGTAQERLTSALDHLGPAAGHAIGAKIALVALGSELGDDLEIHVDRDMRPLLQHSGLTSLTLDGSATLLANAWRLQRPLISVNPTEWGDHLRRLTSDVGGVRSVLVVPLLGADRPYGLLVACSERTPLFLEDELGLLVLLADLVIPAIENSQLYADAQRRAAERQALVDISRAVAEETDVTALARRIVVPLGALLPADAWSMLLPTLDGGLEVVAAGGVGAVTRQGQILPTGTGVAGRAFRSAAPVVVEDVRQDPDYAPLLTTTRSVLAVPMRHGDAVLGVLNFHSEKASAYGAAELALAEIAASQTAIAVARVQLIEQLRERNTALEEASRHKSEFLAKMSHELRTPLNAIIGFSELLLDEPEEDYDRPTHSAYLRTIYDSGHHLLALINDILDLSKVEAGKMELHLTTFSLDRVVTGVLDTVEPLARQKGLVLEANVEGIGEILADEGKVKQVLYNLVSNAIKFTPEQGRVAVLAQRLPEGIDIVVEDNGIGIAPEHQERIFEEFHQVDTGLNRQYEGTGLGLALCKRFAELHGGAIWVESAPGQGSRFHLSLPHDLPVTPAAPADDNCEAGSVVVSVDRPLVLIVEDDVRAANLLSRYLTEGGYAVAVASDGRQALDKACTLQPVAITLDVMLPELDGWEVLHALKEDKATREIPVAVVSITENDALARALGAVDCFVKPVKRQALLGFMGRNALTRSARGRPVCVLTVDDDPAALELIGGFLRPCGANVLCASSGVEGIAVARREQPDLILLDLMMPGMDGFQVVSALKGDASTRDIPIAIVTAKDITEEDKAMLNGYVAATLQKQELGSVDVLAWLGDLQARGRIVVGVGHELDESAPLVLVVEDNEANLLLTQAVLRRAGYRVDEARSAEDVLERLRVIQPFAILMDVQLPGQDGLSLTRQLKADPATAAIPIVALTANAMSGDAERCLQAGCAGYISKPIDTRAFGSTLASILNGQDQPSEAPSSRTESLYVA